VILEYWSNLYKDLKTLFRPSNIATWMEI
jgi:hypothetical protein